MQRVRIYTYFGGGFHERKEKRCILVYLARELGVQFPKD